MLYRYNSTVVVAAHPVCIAASCLCTLSLSVFLYRQGGRPQKSTRLRLCARIHGRYRILSPSCKPWIINVTSTAAVTRGRAAPSCRGTSAHLFRSLSHPSGGAEWGDLQWPWILDSRVSFPGKTGESHVHVHAPWKNNKDVLLYASCQIASSLTVERRLALY